VLPEVLDLHGQHLPDTAGQTLEEPDVGDGHGQLDVAETLAPHLALGDFHTTFVTDHPAETDTFVFSAVALPVLHRTEDTFAEKTVLFRLERPVVDGLGLRHLTIAPIPDHFRGSELDHDGGVFRRLPGFITK